MNKYEVISLLQLEPHPMEGGYFRRTYESRYKFSSTEGKRHLMTSIYYLLTDDHPVGCLHKNTSDIMHYHHLGHAIEYLVISPTGVLERHVLGADVSQGQTLQLLVQGGSWKTSRLLSGEWGLLSEAVAPGFDYKDNYIADLSAVIAAFPHCAEELMAFNQPAEPDSVVINPENKM